VVKRGQVWTLLRGGSQYRILIISNDEYTASMNWRSGALS